MDAFFLHGSSLPRLFSHRLSGPVWQRGGFRSEIPTACPSSQAGRTNGSQRTENGRREYLPGGKSWRIAKSLFLIPFRAIQWFHMPYGRSVFLSGWVHRFFCHSCGCRRKNLTCKILRSCAGPEMTYCHPKKRRRRILRIRSFFHPLPAE